MGRKCAECDAQIEEKAAICPQCGAPVKKAFSRGIGTAVVGLAVAALIILLVRSCG
ncbi:MAG: zinc-ribbon domain-containing protein [Desulfovibrionales bacterium]